MAHQGDLILIGVIIIVVLGSTRVNYVGDVIGAVMRRLTKQDPPS